MIILTIEIGTREAIGIYAISKELKKLNYNCIVLPRFVLPRLANFIKKSVVIIDGAREVKGRRKLLHRLKKNGNIICLLDMEGFVLKRGAFEVRYPKINTNDIDWILTWGVKFHDKLVKFDLEPKLIKFGNPQFSFFEEYSHQFQNLKPNIVLVNTAFAAADIFMKRTDLDPKQIAITSEIRKNFISYIKKSYSLENVKIRVHPNERDRFYKKHGFNINNSKSISSFEDIMNAKEIIGVNCTTLVEGALLGKKVTNVIFENHRHEEIEAVCYNVNQNGKLLKSPTKFVHEILFTFKSGYSNRYQAKVLAGLDREKNKPTLMLRCLICFFRYVGLLKSLDASLIPIIFSCSDNFSIVSLLISTTLLPGIL